MVKLHSNRAFLGNIALVVFLAFLVTLSFAGQASAVTPTYDDTLEWEGASTDDPGAAVQDNDDAWQETTAQVEITDSTNVTFTIQVMTDAEFSNVAFKIFYGGEVKAEFNQDDLTSIVYNDVYGTAYQVYQVVYDWVYDSLNVDNDYTLGVYISGIELTSITLDLEEPPDESSGGGGGGGSSEVTESSTDTTTTSTDGNLDVGGEVTETGTPGEEVSVTLVADSDAIIDQLEHSDVDQVTFTIPGETILNDEATPVTEANIEVSADTLDYIASADKDVVIDIAGIELQLPPGAIDTSLFAGQDVTLNFNVSKVAEGDTPSPDSAVYKIAGEIYSIEISAFKAGSDTGHIDSFSIPINLTLPYDPESLGDLDPQTLGIYRLTDGEWEYMGGTVDPATGTVSVSRNSLSTYTVMANANASITPIQVASDVSGHWAEAAITELVALEAMTGYPDGTFKPDNPISRAEFATILVKAFQLEQKGDKVFSDTASHWGKNYIMTAYAYGIIEGYSDTIFGPDDPITREQMAAMIVRAAGLENAVGQVTFTDTLKISTWARDAVTIVYSQGIMSGYPDNTFNPGGNATRAEAATTITNALDI